jgi:hypothetical protein
MKICDMQRFARGFGNAHQNFAHPSRQDRCAGEGEDGERHAPAFAAIVQFLLVSPDACERAAMRLEGK